MTTPHETLERFFPAMFGDDRETLLAQIQATTAHGKPYSNRYAFGFRLREGLLCEAWELLDLVAFKNQLKAR